MMSVDESLQPPAGELRATDLFLLQRLSAAVQRGSAARVQYLVALTTELTLTLSIDN